MDARRSSRTVIDPKVRQVGFFAPSGPPDRTQSVPVELASPPLSNVSPSGNSLSPVMIPPPRHASDNLSSSIAFQPSRAAPVPVPMSPLRRISIGDNMPLGSYNPSETLFGTSLTPSPSSKIDDGEFSEFTPSPGRIRRSNSGKVASSLPSGGFDMKAVKSINFTAASKLTTVSVVKMPPGVSEKGDGGLVEVRKERPPSSNKLKEKTSKAERRALQEAQRAAKGTKKMVRQLINPYKKMDHTHHRPPAREEREEPEPQPNPRKRMTGPEYRLLLESKLKRPCRTDENKFNQENKELEATSDPRIRKMQEVEVEVVDKHIILME